MIVDRGRLLYLSMLTLFGLSAIGVLFIYFLQERQIIAVLTSGKKPFFQICIGLFYGSFSALLAVLLIRAKPFHGIRNFFSDLINDINPNFAEILLYSASAGIGEEILFRAGLQPLIGIWPASILFVALHGYIGPKNIKLSIYGVFLIIVSAGLGYLFKFFGLYSSVVAHFIYDVTMFCVLRYTTWPSAVQKI
jgi:hypothetical protein